MTRTAGTRDIDNQPVGKATLVAVTPKYIYLRKADGTVVQVERSQLARSDKMYVSNAKLGYRVYFVSRPLAMFGKRAGNTEINLPGNHSFIYIVDENGYVVAVYSWMSGGTKGQNYWAAGGAADWEAAKKDAALQAQGTGLGQLVASGDQDLRDAVYTAFKILQSDPNGGSNHWNGLVLGGNCKMEASKLLSLALIALNGEQAASNWIATHWWIDVPLAGGIFAGAGFWMLRPSNWVPPPSGVVAEVVAEVSNAARKGLPMTTNSKWSCQLLGAALVLAARRFAFARRSLSEESVTRRQRPTT